MPPMHPPEPLLSAADPVELLACLGHLAYAGEGVTQLQHAWQCGRLAQRAHASPALQLASWLHDLGHLMSGLPGTPTLRGTDDRHEALAAAALQAQFGAAVSTPVALHVQAKRYLVARQPRYRNCLSADSLRSLALQGGPMTEAQCQAFEAEPHAQDALRLRAWDDCAKLPDWQPRSTQAALDELRALMGRVAAG